MSIIDKWWTNVKVFFIARKITTHMVWMGLLTFAGLYTGSDKFSSMVSQLFIGHPVIVTKIGRLCADVTALAGIWAMLSNPHTDAGTVAHAAAIQAAPNSPTDAQITAATTK